MLREVQFLFFALKNYFCSCKPEEIQRITAKPFVQENDLTVVEYTILFFFFIRNRVSFSDFPEHFFIFLGCHLASRLPEQNCLDCEVLSAGLTLQQPGGHRDRGELLLVSFPAR